ncbi:MAG: type 1 glutamine amidotransferase [Nocardioidaceae bacterium]
MRALVIQHDHVSPPGPIGDRLEERLVDMELHQVVPLEEFHSPGVEARFPDVTGFDLVVAMGAPWSVYDEARVGSWVAPELDLLREADREGIPVLGICFGGQLLSAAHGGSVEASPYPEIGWVTIETDDHDLVPPGPWFQWHSDRWVLPPGAVEVARNSAASQAYVLRRNLAVQFHPELTSGMLHGWLDNGGDAEAIRRGEDPRELYEATVAEDPASRARAYVLVDSFLDRVARP